MDAQKGLFVNSRNLCFKPKRNRAAVAYAAHNGRRAKGRPVVRASGCGKKGKRKKHKGHQRRGGHG